MAPQNGQKIQRSLSIAHHFSVWRSVVGTVKKSHMGVQFGKALGLALGLAVTYAQQCDNGRNVHQRQHVRILAAQLAQRMEAEQAETRHKSRGETAK